MTGKFAIPGIIALLGFFIYHQCFRKNASLSLPPGPKPLPIIGNLLDLPPPGTPEFQHWLKFKDTYGPISSVTVLGQTIVILHDKQAAYDIMEKMAIKTSNRPNTIFGTKLCGLQNFVSSKQYDATFRLHRKLIHQQLGTKANAAQFISIPDIESQRFLHRALKDPKNVIQHFKTETAATVLKMTYGYSVDPHKADPLVSLIDHMMNNFSRAMIPLSWLVDIIPALRHLPDWFPGTSFKETARQWNRINHAAVDIPFSFVRRQMANGTHRPSYVSSLIEQHSSRDDVKNGEPVFDAIKWTAGLIYGAAADTTASTLSACVMAMALFPEVQRKAQEEIDSVIGTTPDRLPQFEDRERLPYISALVKESIRWYPIVPINTAHATSQEITYGGYRIPTGSYLLASTWWFSHDPQIYPDPSSFCPERFLEPRNEPDPINTFGWGRRICPGRFIADNSLFITIARMVATFNISKEVDNLGREIEPKVEYSPGLISFPGDFPFNFTVRTEKHAELIRSTEVDVPWEKGDADLLEFEDELQMGTN